jgi:hypothetical protein
MVNAATGPYTVSGGQSVSSPGPVRGRRER